MWRHASKPRKNWLDLVREDGLIYAKDPKDGRAYWHEGHYYEFTEAEVTTLEVASEELHGMVVEACRRVADDRSLLAKFGIPVAAQPLLQASMARNLEEEEPTVYGRFDLAFDGLAEPKMLEYNADTPAGLVEAAVCQWRWVEQVMPSVDQANTLHERLVQAWRDYKPYLGTGRLHLVSGSKEPAEDLATVCYLRDTANEAGLETVGMYIENVGWDYERRAFIDLEDNEIAACFKMWPWLWMFSEEFGDYILSGASRTTWVEPMWKVIAESKALLAVMWEMYEGHPNLLPAYLDGPRDMPRYAAKPVAGWEGAGVVLIDGDTTHQQPPGHTVGQPLVWQEFVDIARFDGALPVVGSWIVDGACAGFGIRESDGPITNEGARFLPHVINAPITTPEEVAALLRNPAPSNFGSSSDLPQPEGSS